MKRKLLSILLTFCLAFSLLPTVALADGEKVAQVGETKYATLQKAVNAANDNTVKLLENVTEDIIIPTGINVTLDLNGHKITNVSGHTITVEKGGKLNISDSVGTGVVDNTSHGKGAIVNSGEVTLNGGTFKRSAEMVLLPMTTAETAGTPLPTTVPWKLTLALPLKTLAVIPA